MPAIGHVTKHQDGNFKGQLKTLSFTAPIDILLNPSKNGEKQGCSYFLSSGMYCW